MIVQIPKKRNDQSIIKMSNKEYEIFTRDWIEIKNALNENDLTGELKESNREFLLEVHPAPSNFATRCLRIIAGNRMFRIVNLALFAEYLREKYESEINSGEMFIANVFDWR